VFRPRRSGAEDGENGQNPPMVLQVEIRARSEARPVSVAALISAWRHRRAPMVFVRHDSKTSGSPLAPDTLGNGFKDVVSGEPDVLVTKRVHSAFSGSPDLDAWLRSGAVSDVAICGITTNHCCDTMARAASDLGYRVLFVLDATHAFDQLGPDGSVIRADDVYRMTGASLEGEFARVVSTGDVL
jgi:nicotinamidase-related amidase